MDNQILLEKVKSALGITGKFHDTTILLYIDEVKEFMIDAGVNLDVVQSSAAVGTITRGVSDLWNYGTGNANLSPYFKERAIQLKYKGVDDDV